MESQENKPVKPPTGPGGGLAPPRKPSSNVKWYAIIVVLLVIIGTLGVLAFYHPQPAQPAATDVQAGIATARTGQTANFYINATGTFSNVTVFYGDGTSQVIGYNNNNTVKLTHTYQDPGNYYIMYTFHYSSGTSSGLINVVVSNLVTNLDAAYRTMSINPEASSQQLISNRTAIFGNNSHVSMFLSGNPETYNYSNGINNYQIVDQNYTLWQTVLNGSQALTTVSTASDIPYVYNPSGGVYQATDHTFVFTGLTLGLYQLELNTTTANVNYTQTLTTAVTNTSTINLTSASDFYFLPNSMISGNISGLSLSSVPATNLTVSDATALNFSGSTQMYTASDFAVNLTYSTGNVTVSNSTTSMNLTVGVISNISAGYMISFTGNANLTFLVNGTGETPAFSLNDTATSFMVYGSKATAAIGFVNLTPAHIVDGVNGVTYAVTLSGSNGNYDNYIGSYPTSSMISTTFFMDIPVVQRASQEAAAAKEVLVNAELASGGPTTLDPQIAYFTVDGEVLQNTMQTLLMYNGTSVTDFLPQLASSVPSIANGQINSGYGNYTQTTPWGATYNTFLQPYENYTFHIRANATWQDGSPVTAWDVEYTLVRDLLFINAAPGTGGFIFGEYYLPFPYADTGSFYNITSNMTVDNATNTITIHFQHPMTPSLVFQTVAQTSGSYVVDASWLQLHGAGIPWSEAGFVEYAKTGNLGSYNTFVQQNVFADGPYEISYYLPGSEIVLTKNPTFVAPGSWYPVPTIDNIVINWLASPTTQFLAMKSGEAQIGNIPTSLWTEVQQMTSAGIMQQLEASPTLGIYFMAFNSYTNTTIASQNGYQVNMPDHLFASVKVRKAFNYAFNVTQYLAYDVGNVTYDTSFGIPYVGMIPKGMAFYNTTAQLNATTGGQAPYYSMAMAKQMWNTFVNGTDPEYQTTHNLSYLKNTANANFDSPVLWNATQGKFLYKGSPLQINIFIPQGDPTDQAGMGNLATLMESVITGSTITVQTVTYVQLYAIFAINTQNPMSINWGGWAPDYPGPADYLLPMYLGTNTSTYMKPNGMLPYEVAPYNTTEAQVLQNMIQEYNNGFNSSGVQQGQYFQQMNANGINLSLYIPLYQVNAIPVISTALNGPLWLEYQSGVMTGANGMPMYNLAQYN